MAVTTSNKLVDEGAGPARPAPFVGDVCSPTSLLMLVLLSELLAVAYTVLLSGVRQFDFLLLAYASLFLLWGTLGAAALLCRLRGVFARLGTARSAGLSFIVCLLWVALLSVSCQMILSATGNEGIAGLDWWWILDSLVLATIIIGISLRYIYLGQQLRERQQSALNARLDALQSRIRPHFLFNTLNSISSLIVVDPQRAEQAVEDLAALFRANLSGSQKRVSWSEERALCQSYLRIEQNRLADRLQVDWQETASHSPVRVPSLILQPLLENAILHGIQRLPGGGTLHVQVVHRDGMITVEIRNPCPPLAARGAGNGQGGNNIRQRLEALYGSRASLQMHSAEDYFVARLNLPTTGPAGEVAP
ncbi:sensor histidine kinase [Spongiibacter taiwanensis]